MSAENNDLHLHSNMDRLKPEWKNGEEVFEWIYIPIWID